MNKQKMIYCTPSKIFANVSIYISRMALYKVDHRLEEYILNILDLKHPPKMLKTFIYYRILLSDH